MYNCYCCCLFSVSSIFSGNVLLSVTTNCYSYGLNGQDKIVLLHFTRENCPDIVLTECCLFHFFWGGGGVENGSVLPEPTSVCTKAGMLVAVIYTFPVGFHPSFPSVSEDLPSLRSIFQGACGVGRVLLELGVWRKDPSGVGNI